MSRPPKAARERKLPVQQLTILAICRFAEPISSTSLFPYLPEMVKSFGVPQDEIGKWAGICSAVFSICQACTGIPWGRFSDQYGRKLAILLGLSSTMITSLLWGFSTNLTMAIIARSLAGAGNGNVGIIRTTVAEMVPFKELQPRAFSLMPLVWTIGSVFGPMIGGVLANPYHIGPRERIENPNLLQRFPYALPNIVSACLFMIGIITGILFLEETLETLVHRRDYGLFLGRKLKRALFKLPELLHLRPSPVSKGSSYERDPLLRSKTDEETLSYGQNKPAPPPPSYKEVLNRQAVLNLVVYTFLALHTMGYDQLLPVFMQYTPLRSRFRDDGDGNPFKFAGGFGLDHFRIGLISTAYALFGMAIQFYLFPPVARRFGILNCLKACVIAFPIAYILTPFTALLPTQESQMAGVFAVMLIKCFGSIFAFPCSTILLTNSANSLRVLGTLNGFATSFSAIGRACGPASGGATFSAGVKAGYVIAPFALFSAIAAISAIPTWWLIEGEGFGGDDDGNVSDEEEIDDDILQAEALEGQAEASGKPGPILATQTAEQQEAAYGTMRPLSRTTTMSSHLTLGSTVDSIDEEEGSPATGMPTPGLSRRGSRRVIRRMSMPFGTGNQGISRRLSSNLGQSLGGN